MMRIIEMDRGYTITVDDEKHRIVTLQEWVDEGKRRFGKEVKNWKFQCPMCGCVYSIQEFLQAGADDINGAYVECIGRYTGKGAPQKGDSTGCNWAAYGLLGIPNNKGIIVIKENRKGLEVFDFAK